MKQVFCAKCKIGLDTKAKYCRVCNAEYMRDWRKTHPLSDEQRLKGIVRSKTKMLIKRGKLTKLPCEICGEIKVEAHHDDYNDCINVRWLCRKHHKEFHSKLRSI